MNLQNANLWIDKIPRNPVAQFNLAMCYYHGWGIAIDRQLAFSYFHTAAALGHMNAQFQLGCCYLNGIETKRSYKLAIQYFKLAYETRTCGSKLSIRFML